MEKAVRDMTKYYNKCRQDALEYEIRDQVYLKGSHISMTDHQRNWKTDGMALSTLLQK